VAEGTLIAAMGFGGLCRIRVPRLVDAEHLPKCARVPMDPSISTLYLGRGRLHRTAPNVPLIDRVAI